MYDTLILEGGGVAGLGHIGALKELEARNMININQIAGSSIGAVVACLVACGYTAQELIKIFNEIDLASLQKTKWKGLCFSFLSNLFKGYGRYRTDNLYELLGELIDDKLDDKDITFEQMYEETGIHLIVTGTNITENRTEYFGKDYSPNMIVRKAVLISASYPFAFDAVEHNGCLYVDGGLLNNFPLFAFDRDSDGVLEDNMLGLKLVSPEEMRNTDDFYSRGHPQTIDPVKTQREISNVYDYVTSIIFNMHMELNYLQEMAVNASGHNVALINTKHIKTLDFNLSKEDIALLIEEGHKAILTLVLENESKESKELKDDKKNKKKKKRVRINKVIEINRK